MLKPVTVKVGALALAVLSVVLVAGCDMAVPVPAQAAVTPATFAWDGQSWCPSYQEQSGCASTQHPKQYSVSFAPSQVSEQNGYIKLALNQEAGVSGAFNSESKFTVGVNQWVHVKLDLTCVNGVVSNWPAFWLDGTAGPWPAHGEIDVMEELKAGPAWHYHYVNAAGQDKQVGATVPGNWCGWHAFGVNRLPNQIEFHWDGKLVGDVTAAQIGVPLVTDPMYVIFDYGASTTAGGPLNEPDGFMRVGSLTTGTDR